MEGPLDGPPGARTPGPRIIEVYALEDIEDMSQYGLESVKADGSGAGSSGTQSFTFDSGPLPAGSYLTVARNAQFVDYFGFNQNPSIRDNVAGTNGRMAKILYYKGVVADVFGDTTAGANCPPNGTCDWNYKDGWAYRKNGRGPSPTFNSDDWHFSGPDALVGCTTNDACTSKFPVQTYGSGLVITSIIDGPLSGGTPKAIEVFALQDISDMSQYGLESANNGGGSNNSPEYTFPAQPLTAGQFFTVAANTASSTQYNTYFGSVPDATSNVVNVNGDDAFLLYFRGNPTSSWFVVDSYGVVGEQPTAGNSWNYKDRWVLRDNGSRPSFEFDINDWTISNDLTTAPACTANTQAGCPGRVRPV